MIRAISCALILVFVLTAMAHAEQGGNANPQMQALHAEKEGLMREFKQLHARKEALMQEFRQRKEAGGDISGLESQKQQLMAEMQALEARKQELMKRFQAAKGGAAGGQAKPDGRNKEAWQQKHPGQNGRGHKGGHPK